MDYYNKIALSIYGSVGIPTIRKLFELGHTPSSIIVFTHHPEENDNKMLISFLEYFDVDTFIVGNDMTKMAEILYNNSVHLLINIGYSYIYKEPVLGMPSLTLINIHPGILPHYRGWLSVPWSIFNGEKYAGYTCHIISKGIDRGDIILQEKTPILPTSTAFDLHFKLHDMALSGLDFIINGKWEATPQVGEGKYYKKQFPNRIHECWNWVFFLYSFKHIF